MRRCCQLCTSTRSTQPISARGGQLSDKTFWLIVLYTVTTLAMQKVDLTLRRDDSWMFLGSLSAMLSITVSDLVGNDTDPACRYRQVLSLRKMNKQGWEIQQQYKCLISAVS